MTALCSESILLTEWRRWINVGLADGTLCRSNGSVDVHFPNTQDLSGLDEAKRRRFEKGVS